MTEAKLPRLDLPLSLKSAAGITRVWEQHAGPLADDFALRAAARANERVGTMWPRLEPVRQARNPADTAAAHLQKIQAAAKRILADHTKVVGDALSDVDRRLVDIDFEVGKRLGVAVPGPNAAEIRAALRGLDNKARGEVIQKAIRDGDLQILGPALSGHELLTGIPSALRSKYREQAKDVLAGDLAGLETALEKAKAHLENGLQDAADLADRAGGAEAVQKRFREAAEAADQAALMLNEALG